MCLWMILYRENHQRHLWLGQENKSALAHHAWATGHSILFDDTTVLCKSSYGTRIIRESIEIQLRVGVINKEDGARLSTAWLPALDLLREGRERERESCNRKTIKYGMSSRDGWTRAEKYHVPNLDTINYCGW